jgi:hypothetical protein
MNVLEGWFNSWQKCFEVFSADFVFVRGLLTVFHELFCVCDEWMYLFGDKFTFVEVNVGELIVGNLNRTIFGLLIECRMPLKWYDFLLDADKSLPQNISEIIGLEFTPIKCRLLYICEIFRHKWFNIMLKIIEIIKAEPINIARFYRNDSSMHRFNITINEV